MLRLSFSTALRACHNGHRGRKFCFGLERQQSDTCHLHLVLPLLVKCAMWIAGIPSWIRRHVSHRLTSGEVQDSLVLIVDACKQNIPENVHSTVLVAMGYCTSPRVRVCGCLRLAFFPVFSSGYYRAGRRAEHNYKQEVASDFLLYSPDSR